MRVYYFADDPRPAYLTLVSDLLDAPVIHTGEWQAMDTSRSQLHATHELEDVTAVWDNIPSDPGLVVPGIDLEWAREHFNERVSAIPLNPAPSHERWPYAVRGNADHTDSSTKFDHTYPERFWPRHAGHRHEDVGEWWKNPSHLEDHVCGGHSGIRFPLGDLYDVVGLLATKPLTRQAYLPIWFPEDTGATEDQRVPCTLGYHFMQRGNRLSCRYYMRSCEVYRHFSNDVYFAAMLTRWICEQIKRRTNNGLRMVPGSLVMHISSFHAFVGDRSRILERMERVSGE